MPTLAIFITLAIILAIVLTCIVLIPWLRADKSGKSNQLMAINVDVFKQRLQELQADYQEGRISDTAFKSQKTELERQLLQASDEHHSTKETSIKEPPIPQLSKQEASIKEASIKEASIMDNETGSNIRLDTPKPIATTSQTRRLTGSIKDRVIILIWLPLLMGIGYVVASDRSPVYKLWHAQDELGQVADDLLTGKIDSPPQWATEDSVGLLSAIQTNVHHHAYDSQRWMHLADVFLAFDANEQALEALARAYRLDPSDETIAVRYAQTEFFTNNGVLNADGRQALSTVLHKNPNHQGAQILMAMGEARAGNYENAQRWIDRLRTAITAKEGDHSAALQSLDELSQNINAQQQSNTQQSTAQAIEVTVKINPSIRPLVEAEDILFVTVKAASGGAPLAVKRIDAQQLIQSNTDGLKVELSDTDAMMPNHTITSAMISGTPLIVTARISKSGQALSESGDLTANTIDIDATQQKDTTHHVDEPITVITEINQQVP